MVFKRKIYMPCYLRTHLLLQLSFGLVSILTTLMLLSLAVLTQIRAMAEVKVARVYITLMTLMALLTLMFAWNYYVLYHVVINKASLIIVKGN